jgi:hypothetical protein
VMNQLPPEPVKTLHTFGVMLATLFEPSAIT